MARNTGRHNKLYNYLVNQFGLSKEVILEAVNIRIENVLGKKIEQLFESKRFEKMILDRVTRLVEKGLANEYIFENQAFEKFFRKVVDKAVKEKIDSLYTIEVKVNDVRKPD